MATDGCTSSESEVTRKPNSKRQECVSVTQFEVPGRGGHVTGSVVGAFGWNGVNYHLVVEWRVGGEVSGVGSM